MNNWADLFRKLILTRYSVFGFFVGALLSISVVISPLVIAPFLLMVTFCRLSIKKIQLYVLILYILMIVWIFACWSLLGVFGKHLIQDCFLITILTTCSLFTYKKSILNGLIFAITPILILDNFSNILQLTTGSDYWGNFISNRDDGSRLLGIFGHSFLSLSILFSFFLLFQAAGYRKIIVFLPIILMLIVGPFRGYVILPLVLLYYKFFNIEWKVLFASSFSIIFLIVLATYFSVKFDVVSSDSGNAFRIFAWEEALRIISFFPILDYQRIPTALPEDFAVTLSNLIEYQIYESFLLQDAVRYGALFVFVKLAFLYLIGSINYRICKNTSDSLLIAKNFIVVFLLIDYALFSYFSTPIVALVAAWILAFQPGMKPLDIHAKA